MRGEPVVRDRSGSLTTSGGRFWNTVLKHRGLGWSREDWGQEGEKLRNPIVKQAFPINEAT